MDGWIDGSSLHFGGKPAEKGKMHWLQFKRHHFVKAAAEEKLTDVAAVEGAETFRTFDRLLLKGDGAVLKQSDLLIAVSMWQNSCTLQSDTLHSFSGGSLLGTRGSVSVAQMGVILFERSTQLLCSRSSNRFLCAWCCMLCVSS